MSPQDLFRAGKLSEAIKALGAELRDHPTDHKRRTFMFELLCFAGDYGRAEKHLAIIAETNADANVGALVYRSAIYAERQRERFFETKQYVQDDNAEPTAASGTLNGTRFASIEDADPRIGPRLEVFVAGEYIWLPFAHIASMRMEPPRLLRDTLWPVATIKGAPALKGQDFGQVLLPGLYPFSARHERDTVKLGRETDWLSTEGQDVPYGQKILVLDGETVVPFLEIRTLELDSTGSEVSRSAGSEGA